MRKLIFFLFSFFIFHFISYAQIEKGYWMEGGNITLVFENTRTLSNISDSESESQSHYLLINPNIGYFIKDRFVIGSDFNIQINFPNKEIGSTYGYSIDIGPFLRYYYLNHSKPYNFFSQVGYNYGVGLDENFKKWVDVNKITIKNGFAYFLNESVALETSFNYSYKDFNAHPNFKSTSNNFNISIGFQIHLTKKQ